MQSKIDKTEATALIRAILTSKNCSLSVRQLNKDFKKETGFDIPVFGYQTISGFLHSLVNTIKVEGLYPVEKVSLIKNEKSEHIVSLVMRQKDREKEWKGSSKSAAAKQSEEGPPADKRMRPGSALMGEIENQTNDKKKISENEDGEANAFSVDEETNSSQISSFCEKENEDSDKGSLTAEDEFGDRKWYEGYIYESTSQENEMMSGLRRPVPIKTENGGEQSIGNVTKKYQKFNFRAGYWVKAPESRGRSNEEYLFKPLPPEEEDDSDESEPNGSKSSGSFKEYASPEMKPTECNQNFEPEKEIYPSVEEEEIEPIEVIRSPVLQERRKTFLEELNPCNRMPDINVNEYAKVGNFLEIVLGKINTPAHFYFSLKKYEPELSKLLNTMQVFYSFTGLITDMRRRDIKMGQACAVYYKKLGRNEMAWQRGEIRSIRGRRVVVTLIDTGKVAEVLTHQIKYLYEEFGQLPKLAILGTLAHIRPTVPPKCWTRQSIKRFIDLTFEKHVITRVVSIFKGEPRVNMTLTNTIDQLHVNDVLVAEGLAQYDNEKTDSLLAETLSRSLWSITEGTQTDEDQIYEGVPPKIRREEVQSQTEERRGRGRGNLRLGL